MTAPRREPWGASVNLVEIPRGIVHLSVETARERFAGTEWSRLLERGMVSIDTGQHFAIAGVTYEKGRAIATTLIKNGYIRHAGGLESYQRVLELKPRGLAEAEGRLVEPVWSVPEDGKRYFAEQAAIVDLATDHYSSRNVLRAKFGARVALRSLADRIAGSVLGGRVAGDGSPRALPIVIVGAGSSSTASGTRGGGSLAAAVISALARRTLVVKVSEIFTSQRCPGCCKFLQDCATARRPWRVHVCAGTCPGTGIFNRDIASAVLIGRVFCALCGKEPTRPSYLDWGPQPERRSATLPESIGESSSIYPRRTTGFPEGI